ncbi:MAG: hypothetical protein IPM26_03565 [Saprospiraceae bacterium]|nr:hypothetical protein [Saprospiraceae bacterium]
MNYAVIDLGSNTFHILIAAYEGKGKLKEVFREREFTGLSEGGIEVIKDTAFQRGLECLKRFAIYLKKYDARSVRIVGTAALRSASNRIEFIRQAEEILEHPVEVIDGQKEAWYIYRGITMIPETRTGINIIVDIGGGSTEFILIKDGEMQVAESFKLGIGVLADLFQHSDPLSEAARQNISDHVKITLAGYIQNHMAGIIPDALIGASGSFEIAESMTGETQHYGYCNVIQKDKFMWVHDMIVNASLEQRLNIPGLPAERAKLAPVGLTLMKSVIDLFTPTTILVSSYAMKEGILRDMTGED